MKIIIDGNAIEAEGRKTILDVARENGIFIPSLCDHSELSPFTGCRLCLVAIKDRKGYSPACSTQIDDGMEVRTDTPELRKLRGEIMELILSEHPNACLICAEKENCDDYKSTIRKVGEVTGCVLCSNNRRCELQDVVDAMKIEKVRFPSVYRGFEVKKGDPFFDRNYNLCILCGRCVRVCHELRGASAISFVYRGSDEVIGTVLDRPLLESGCQFCGACVDVCPTGALSERALKYETLHDAQMKTICPLCSIGCELDVWLNKGRLLSVSPSADSEINHGQACVKGRFLVKDLLYSGKRILKPMIKKNNELEETTWDEALDFVAGKLKKFKRSEIALVGSSQATCEDGYLFRKFAHDVLRTIHFNPKPLFSPLNYLNEVAGKSDLTIPVNFKIREIAQAETIVLAGSDIVTSHPIIWLEVLEAVKNGAKLIVISPAEYKLSRHVYKWLQVIPGAESLLFGYLAKISAENLKLQADPQLAGWDDFEKQLRTLSLANVKAHTGIEIEQLEEVAEILSEGAPSVFLLGAEANSQSGPALWNLSLLSQGRFIPLELESNQRGLIALDNFAPRRGPDVREIICSLNEKKVKALYLAGPLSLPKKTKLELLIVQAPYTDQNTERADVVLPSVTFAETEGTSVNIEGRIRKQKKVVEPLGDSKPDWWILCKLAKRLRARGFDFKKCSDIMKEIKAANPSFSKVTDSGLDKNKEFFLEETAQGKKSFIPVKFVQPQVAAGRKSPLSMIVNYSLDNYRNFNLTQEIKGMGLIRNSRYVLMSSEDAEKMDFSDGDPIQVSAGKAKMDGILKISETVPSGVVKAQLVLGEDSRFSVMSLVNCELKDRDTSPIIPVRIKRGK
ncbi:MAG: molybdopterin-dependent oxidoreductase [Candidatus Aminicenantes bacterium]|nr:molybdopterin-dependent oxidoreductase [Candidatus Aminicenantes bacterium]